MFQRKLSHIKRNTPSAPEISEARFRKFLKELGVYERHIAYEKTLDSFLDLYSSWKKTHAYELKIRLVLLAFELHRLDHSFECDLSFNDAKVD